MLKMTGREQQYIQETFDTNRVIPLEPNVDTAERELGAFMGAEHVVALSAGTAASVNPVTCLGTTSVLVDNSAGYWDMDPDLLEQATHDRIAKTNRKPKDIAPVYLYGKPACINTITSVADKYESPASEGACGFLDSYIYEGHRCVGSSTLSSSLSYSMPSTSKTSPFGSHTSSAHLRYLPLLWQRRRRSPLRQSLCQPSGPCVSTISNASLPPSPPCKQ